MPTGRKAFRRYRIDIEFSNISECNPMPLGSRTEERALFAGGRIYLVTFVTHGRKRRFKSFDLGCAASRTFSSSAGAEHADLLCWVLMPDHFHGLIELRGERALSQCVHRLKSQSTRACGNLGRIWARAYHDHAVRKEEDLRARARYVIANPVRAGLVECVLQYPFWNASWL